MAFRSLMPFSRSGASGDISRRSGGTELDPFFSIRRDMDRIFDEMMRGFGGGLPGAFGANGAAPRIDVKEDEAGVEVTAELPGVDEKEIDVELSDDVLTIRGEKKIEKEEGGKEKGYYLNERSYGAFARSIQLPYGAESDKISAEYSKGVLRIRVPRPPEVSSKAKKIEVKAA
jgi:HSP20 family protein